MNVSEEERNCDKKERKIRLEEKNDGKKEMQD